jgi:MFS family permease
MKRNYMLITAISFILFMSRGIVGPLGSVYTRSLGASFVAIGALSTVTSFMSVVFAYFWGRASDLVQRRKSFLLLGLAFMGLDAFFTSLVPNYVYLFPLRIFDAIAQAAYGVSSLALMGDILGQSKSGRGWRMGAYRGFASLGFGLMAFIAGYIVEASSLRVPYRISAVFLFIAFVLALQIEERGEGKERKEIQGIGWFLKEVASATALSVRDAMSRLGAALRGGGRTELLADERTDKERQDGPKVQLPLMPLLISSLIWSLAFGAVYALWANYMKEGIGYSERVVSQLWALASSLEFPMMILAGWLSDRIGRLPMLSLGFVSWALVFMGYVFAPTMPWIIGIQVVRSFAFSAFTATAMVYAAEVRGNTQRGQVSGLYSSAGGIGSILGATVGGAITQAAGFRTMIGSMAAVILGGALYLAKQAWQHRIRVRRAQA